MPFLTLFCTVTRASEMAFFLQSKVIFQVKVAFSGNNAFECMGNVLLENRILPFRKMLLLNNAFGIVLLENRILPFRKVLFLNNAFGIVPLQNRILPLAKCNAKLCSA